MKIVLNDVQYDVEKRKGIPCDNYYSKGIIVENVKFPFLYTHVAYIDGYKTGVKPKYLLLKGLALLCLLCIIVTGIMHLLPVNKNTNDSQSVNVDTGIVGAKKDGTVTYDEEVVLLRYNKYLLYQNGRVDLRLVNGKREADIIIVGNEVEMEEVHVQPQEELLDVPVKLNTDSSIVNANLRYSFDGKSLEYPIVIEVQEEQKIDENADVTFEDEEVIYE